MGKPPIKIQFPCFGRKDDDADPLRYVEKCHDYLALNPLLDEDIIVMFSMALPVTVGMWHVEPLPHGV